MKNNLIKTSIFTAFLSVLIIFSGCSAVTEKLKPDGKPTAAMARKRFESLNKKILDEGTIKINSFEKTNAVDHINQYNLMWKTEIEYLKDAEIPCCLKDEVYRAGGTIKAGEKRTIDGTYLYFPTENGYKLRDDYGRYIEP